MLRLLKAAIAVCLVSSLTAATASAAPVNFVGTVSPGNALWAAGTAMSLNIDYTPVAALMANINSATLIIGSQTWNVGAVANGLTLTQNAGLNNDNLDIAITNFGVSTPGGWGSVFSDLALTINGNVDAVDLTQANVDALAAFGTPGNGAFFLRGNLPVAGNVNSLLGGTAVPEPGSIALLSGLGLVFGRGAWRRRKAKQVAA